MLISQTNAMTNQVQCLEEDLEHDKDQDWSQSLRAGPECLAILGECILLTTRPSVTGIELEGPGLPWPMLSTNLTYCADAGEETFRLMARGMKKVARWTPEISKPGGLIEKLLMFCDAHQTEARDEYLLGMVGRGEEIVAECKEELEKIDTSFGEWYKVTKSLHYALQAKLGQTRRQEEETESQIKQNEIERTFSEKQQKIVEERAQERQKRFDKVVERREQYDEMVTDLVSCNGIRDVIGKMVKCVVGGAMLGAVGYIHYRRLSAELYSAEEAQAKRDRELHELEVSQAKLETAVAHLSTESKSIEEVTRIVEESIEKVMELQGLIRTFMEFLLGLNAIISNTVSRSKLVYDTMSNREGLKDPLIKKDLWENALAMKIRFIFAAKASHIYNAVSNEFIEPTANRFQGLRRLNKASDEELRQEIQELYALRHRVCEGTERLASRMHQELNDALRDVPAIAAGGSEDPRTGNGEWDYVARPQQINQ